MISVFLLDFFGAGEIAKNIVFFNVCLAPCCSTILKNNKFNMVFSFFNFLRLVFLKNIEKQIVFQ